MNIITIFVSKHDGESVAVKGGWRPLVILKSLPSVTFGGGFTMCCASGKSIRTSGKNQGILFSNSCGKPAV
jgi:hypothetical protein